MGQIKPADYPFIEIGEGLSFSDDPPVGSLGIKPFLDMVNKMQRIMAGIHGGATGFGRYLETDSLVGHSGSGAETLTPHDALYEFRDGEKRPLGLIGDLVGLSYTSIPSETTIDYEEFPEDERYDKSQYAGFFPGLQKRAWHAHPYVYGATYENPVSGAVQSCACFDSGQPLWWSPFLAMKTDLDEIKGVETDSRYGMDAESGFPYGDDIGFYEGSTYIGRDMFAEKIDDQYIWTANGWQKSGDGYTRTADNFNGKIDWTDWTTPLDTVTGDVTLADILGGGVLMMLIHVVYRNVLQSDGTTKTYGENKCKIMPFVPLAYSRGWEMYSSLVDEFGDITMPPKPSLSSSQYGLEWKPTADVSMSYANCLLGLK